MWNQSSKTPLQFKGAAKIVENLNKITEILIKVKNELESKSSDRRGKLNDNKG